MQLAERKKAANKRYRQSEAGKAARKRYRQTHKTEAAAYRNTKFKPPLCNKYPYGIPYYFPLKQE
jgi:hypothetical protein